jgi:hypothetical protein
LVVPFLLFTTDLSAQTIAGTSLVVVLVSSLSGAFAYARHKKIDYRLGTMFALVGLPSTVLGYFVNQMISVNDFALIFGVLMFIAALLLLRNYRFEIPHYIPKPVHFERHLCDCTGKIYDYVVSLRRAAVLAFSSAFVSPVIGIGGGPIRVPFMIMVLRMPPKIAAATSQIATFGGTVLAVALFAGSGHIAYNFAFPLAIGVLVGAQVGASFAKRVNTSVVRKFMSVAFGFVGVWMILKVFI